MEGRAAAQRLGLRLLCLCLCLASVTATAGWPFDIVGSGPVIQRVSLAQVDSLAVCVDGTPAAYYWAPAELPAPPADEASPPALWIVDLQGGGWCYNAADCATRCPMGSDSHYCSSRTYQENMSMPSGIFQPLHDDVLARANKVFVPYCTSDGHMADREAFGRQFRGARVLQAVLTDLVNRHGLGSGPSGRQDTLLLAGQSAGGRGAMVHLDYISEMLGPEAAPNVEVVGLLDSPLWVDVPPHPSSGFVGFGKQCREFFANFRPSHLGSKCVAAYPTIGEAWKCVMGEYRMPHLKTPYLLVASQYDAFQLGMNHIPPFFADASQRAYAEDIASRVQELVKSLRANWPPSAVRQNAVLSWSCYDHASSLTRRGFDKQTCGADHVTVDSAFSQFMGLALAPAAPASPSLQWVDTCKGFACGPGCRFHADHLLGESNPAPLPEPPMLVL